MVDIVIATFNGEKYIRQQLDSILNQTYRDIRIIIRDDGSDDDTVLIVKEYEKKNPEKVKLIIDSVKCGSSPSNFMQAMKNTSADYIMFSDQDDYWLPIKVQHSLEHMLEIENKVGKDKPVLIFGSYRPVDENLNDIADNVKKRQEAAYKLNFSSLLVQNYVNGCLMMVNRRLLNMMGEYDDRILMHDWWAALLAAGAGEIKHIEEVMMLYRQHGNNVVGSVNVKSTRYRLRKLLDPSTRKTADLYLKQAKLLCERNNRDLKNENRESLSNFINLYTKRKLFRVISLIRGNYLKSDFVRILGQLFYI